MEKLVTDILNSIVEEMEEDPYDINDGACGEFARRAKERLGDEGIKAERPVDKYIIEDCFEKGYAAHEWVYVPSTGKNYDAECTEGVQNALDLPIFKKIDYAWDEDEVIENRFTTED